MDQKLRHDFINNCLRIEVLQKLIIEDLESGNIAQKDLLEDYKTFMEEQLERCSELPH